MKRYIKYLVICTLIAVLGILIGPAHKANAATRKTMDVGKGNVEIKKNGDYNLVGSTKEYTVTIDKGVKANIWMKDVTIEAYEYCEQVTFDIKENANVNLILSGTNSIQSSTWSDYNYEKSTTFDAIKLGKGAKLTIADSSTGSLELRANGYGSGIGGQGIVTVNGGTLLCYGGTYGAGIGNMLDESKMQVVINGGMVYAYGGIGFRESESWEYQHLFKEYADMKIKDMNTSKITITGGMVMAADTSVTPVNKKGVRLYPQIFNCKSGKFKKISVDKVTYGCTGINSKGYLAIWTPSMSSKIELTYANGKKESIQGSWSGVVGDTYDRSKDYDIEEGSFLFLKNGFIYDNHVYTYGYGENQVKITGMAEDNTIMIEGNAKLLFDSLNIVQQEATNASFLTIGNDVKAVIEFNGTNDFTAGAKNCVMLVGNHATLLLTESKPKNEVNLVLNDKAKGIYTECGTIEQYGTCILANTDPQSQGIFIGCGGLYTLNHGELNSVSKEGKTIHVLSEGTVKVCGGSISAVNIGFYDESNEECTDRSTFILIGGKVNVSNRMMFRKFVIYGGELNCHLLGSGSGSKFYQYDGNVAVDVFITNYAEGLECSDPNFHYDFTTNTITGSAILKDYLYGGTYTESGKVTPEEMQKVSIGLC